MQDKRGDFSNDLSDLKNGIDVEDILTALKTKKENDKSIDLMRPIRADNTTTSEEESRPKLNRLPSPRAPSKARNESQREPIRVGLCNVTTRLTLSTNEQLTKAALRQKLKGSVPSTRQDILEVAVKEWLRKQGYAKSVITSDETPAESEPLTDS